MLIPITGGPEGVGAVLGGLGRTKIDELVSAGDLAKVRVGRRAFVTAKSVAAYVDRLASDSGGGA
ncbi:DNA-binding protein [Mycobacteroides abscessus]|nr:DNA-binding protein [Mycobacteroides abscessus]